MTTDMLGPIRHLIGSRYVESVKAYALELTGLQQAAGPHDITTRDLRSDRLLIDVDEHGIISGVRIG